MHEHAEEKLDANKQDGEKLDDSKLVSDDVHGEKIETAEKLDGATLNSNEKLARDIVEIISLDEKHLVSNMNLGSNGREKEQHWIESINDTGRHEDTRVPDEVVSTAGTPNEVVENGVGGRIHQDTEVPDEVVFTAGTPNEIGENGVGGITQDAADEGDLECSQKNPELTSGTEKIEEDEEQLSTDYEVKTLCEGTIQDEKGDDETEERRNVFE